MRGQSSFGIRDARRVCWVSELRFWLWAESSAGELTEGQCRNSQHSKNCLSLSPRVECPGYDIKLSDGKVPVMLELWGMRCTPSLPLIPCLLWSGVVALNRVPCPVGWGCRIHRLLLCRGVRPLPPTRVLDMTLNNLMVRFQECWSFGKTEYHIIAIAPRSTLARSGSTW